MCIRICLERRGAFQESEGRVPQPKPHPKAHPKKTAVACRRYERPGRLVSRFSVGLQTAPPLSGRFIPRPPIRFGIARRLSPPKPARSTPSRRKVPEPSKSGDESSRQPEGAPIDGAQPHGHATTPAQSPQTAIGLSPPWKGGELFRSRKARCLG